MKKFSIPILGLTLAATAAYAQDVPGDELPPPDSSVTSPADPAGPPPADPAAPPPADALPPEPAPADALPPEPGAEDPGDVSAGAFTDAEIDSFAKATVAVQEIDADATLDVQAKQEQMASAVTDAGLNPAKYNEIGQALATDTELRAKVQTAMARHATPSDG